jgi:hypothetical protein
MSVERRSGVCNQIQSDTEELKRYLDEVTNGEDAVRYLDKRQMF